MKLAKAMLSASLLGVLLARQGASAEPLDLTACVKLALRGNPQVQDATDVSDSAALAKQLALAEYHLKIVPAVDGGLRGGNTTNQSYGLLFSQKLLATGATVEVNGGTNVYSTVPQVSVPYATQARATLLQPLFQGWSHAERYEHLDDADRRVAAAVHASSAAREDIALGVVRTFYDVVRAGELRAIADRSLKQTAELENAARAKLEIGGASKMDVYRVELQTARIKATVVDQTAKHDASLDDLKALLGIDPRVRIEIDSRVQGPVVADMSEAEAIELAAAKRVEVIEAHDQVVDAERKLWLAKRHLLPEVDFATSYARIGTGNSFDDSLNLNRPEWTVGLRSSFPLDRTPEKVALSEAEIALRGQERRYRVLRDDVAREVRQAMRQLRSATAQVELAAEVAGQADQQAELAHERYAKGVTDNFDLVQAEAQLAEARGSQVLAAIDQVAAGAVLLHTTGELVAAFGESPAPTETHPDDTDPGKRFPAEPGPSAPGVAEPASAVAPSVPGGPPERAAPGLVPPSRAPLEHATAPQPAPGVSDDSPRARTAQTEPRQSKAKPLRSAAKKSRPDDA